MCAIPLPRSRFLTAALLATAAAFSLGGRAAAQPGASLPPLKMFQPLRSPPPSPAAAPAHATVSHGATVAAPVPVQVALTFPGAPDVAFAAIRGPGGEVRYFPVEGGKKELATRVIVVRPGERVHIQLPPPKAR